MSGWAPPPEVVARHVPSGDELAKRLRQAALGCTVHGHGPLNALVLIAEAHITGRLDGSVICRQVAEGCAERMDSLARDSLEHRREEKVALISSVFARGLEGW